MARTPQDVTHTELAILQILWDQGPSTRRQITDLLYPRGGPAQYATVQKLLERLEAKGFVTAKNRGQGVLTFTVSVDRDELISRKLQEMAEKLCGGSMTPLLMNLVRAQPLTDRQLDELRSFVEDLRRKTRRKSERH
jgi:BlaI family transcriptional regulator, penicillinase repressor